jgi:hypothetical protein
MKCPCCGEIIPEGRICCPNCLVYIGDNVPKQSPLKAIKQYCYECSGENRLEVTRCSSPNCPLKPFRKGKNPFLKKREMTPEQKEQAKQRLLKARGVKNG